MRALARVYLAVAKRTAMASLRRPVLLSFSLLQPLMWMALFGFLFQRFPVAGASVNYIDFLLPGICVMTTLFGASQCGIQLIRDLHSGLLQRMLRSSAPPSAILAGKLSADGARLLLQAAVVGVVGWLLGAHLLTAPKALVVAILWVALFACSFAALSCLIALTTRRQELMAGFVHLINMPMLFTSTALVPGRLMPDWLATLAQWNPMSLAVDALRGALSTATVPALGDGLTLLLWAVGTFALAWWRLHRCRQYDDFS